MDAILYEKPIMSCYLFLSWMHCVYADSMSLVPMYFVGFLIFLLLDSYNEHCIKPARHHGYTSLTLTEVLRALMTDAASEARKLEPLLMAKKARDDRNKHFELEPLDHREFPFSERFEYRKRPTEESMMTKRVQPGKKARKQGRYFATYVLCCKLGLTGHM